MILAVRTDKPEAEIGLFKGSEKIDYRTWQAHRELGATIHRKVKEILDGQNAGWSDIEAIVFYKGPGSFTGLRIGAAVCNAIADANKIPVAGSNGENWISEGLELLKNGRHGQAVPEYGSDPLTTSPKK